MKRLRVAASVAVIAGLLAVFFFVPLPFHLNCGFDVKPLGAQTVYAKVPGRLDDVHVELGQTVKKNDVIATMHNLELELALEKLMGDLRELDAQLSVLQKEQRRDETAGTTIDQMLEQRAALEEVIRERTEELNDLQVKAPIDGVVLPVVDKADRESPDGQLPDWVGSPLSPRNRGAFLAAHDRICQIGNPSQLVAEIVIDQADVELVWAAFHDRKERQLSGVPVTLMLDSLPGKSFESEIETVALAKMEETPLGLSTMAGGDVDSVMDPETGVPRPLSTSYPAVAGLPDLGSDLQLGMRGKAKIYVQWQSLGARVYRFVKRTFHFEM